MTVRRLLIRTLLAVLAVGALTAAPCRAQIVAPPMEKKAAELGFAYKWFHRDITSGQVSDISWDVGTLYMRYGASRRITFALEGGLWGIDAPDGADRSFTRWTVGAAVSASVVSRERWRLLATATFNDVYDLDQSSNNSDEKTRSWTAALLLDVPVLSGAHRVDVWAGPMFVDDLTEVFPFGSVEPVRLESDRTIGASAGVHAVVFDVVSAFAYGVYADHLQARIGAAIRLHRGER